MDWQIILLIVLGVLLLVAGGYIKKLVKEVKELVDVFSEAIEDSKISRKELEKIIKEARDVGATANEIIKMLRGLFIRQ